MTQLEKMAVLLGTPAEDNPILEIYLDFAKDIICELRDTVEVESEYQNVQVKIAIELYNKMGAEGQISHDENGLSRTYGKSEVSVGLLEQIKPFVRTPFSTRRLLE